MLPKSLFTKLANIWLRYKEITIGNGSLKWGHVYYKTPVGSERERLAFKRMIETWSEKSVEIEKIYPDYSPPNILRKYAFEYMYKYVHNSFAVLLRSAMGGGIFSDGEISESAREESMLYFKKYTYWYNLVLSRPNSEKEEIALRELKEIGEIFPHMVIRNYVITID